MKIGELARKTGLTPSTIRFYEEQGLLSPVSRTAAGYREYSNYAMERLHVIQVSKRLGFSLDVIRGMFGANGQCLKTEILERTETRLREVEEQQETLASQQRELLALRAILLDESISRPFCAEPAVN
ncbi:MerR family transcriptional regulator [Duganella violaceipulchra]|uniref:DNA-binding transcriptional MerR regulator n=1 Tax=Duganella violaceipulchra TaxID=2849652 RepID=A0AA41LAE3_9BURK|nr:MerR family transcriptional regulator [Duganella violaceicalia]MBV6324160.1 MerR family transcriptional regulator [Duganella violaceicalia]MCP2011907.1 DNA-binding transcriptional MerR regulator [Duganella violaceicalia]